MPLQSTNRVRLSKVRESTFGVTPTSPAFKTQRQTSSSLAVNPQTVVSNEIDSNREVKDLILVGLEAGGDIGGELSFGAADDDLEEALQGTWAAKPFRDNGGVADSVITAVAASTDTYTVNTGVAFVAGHLVYASGFATAANNGLFVAQTGSNATTVVAPASPGLTDEAAPPGAAVLRVVGFQGAAADLAATTAGGNALTSTALNFTTLGLNVGEWVLVGGTAANTSFATAGSNGWCRVSAISANRLSFDRTPSGFATDTGTGKTLQVFAGDFLTNGSTQRSNSFERQYLDHSPVTYEYLRGQVLDQFSVNVPQQNVVTYTKTYMGADGVTMTSRVAGATDIAAPTGDVLNSSSNVGRLGFDGSALVGPNFVSQATINIANNLRRQNAVGSIGAIGIGNGEFNVSGTLETYFGDKGVLDKVVGNTLTSFDFRVGRADGTKPQIIFDLPSIKLSSGSPSVSGKNADVMVSAGFQAIRSATYGYTMSVGRFFYTP